MSRISQLVQAGLGTLSAAQEAYVSNWNAQSAAIVEQQDALKSAHDGERAAKLADQASAQAARVVEMGGEEEKSLQEISDLLGLATDARGTSTVFAIINDAIATDGELDALLANEEAAQQQDLTDYEAVLGEFNISEYDTSVQGGAA